MMGCVWRDQPWVSCALRQGFLAQVRPPWETEAELVACSQWDIPAGRPCRSGGGPGTSREEETAFFSASSPSSLACKQVPHPHLTWEEKEDAKELVGAGGGYRQEGPSACALVE